MCSFHKTPSKDLGLASAFFLKGQSAHRACFSTVMVVYLDEGFRKSSLESGSLILECRNRSSRYALSSAHSASKSRTMTLRRE